MRELTEPSSRRAKDFRLYMLIYLATFPVFLVASLLRRLFLRRDPAGLAGRPGLTVFQEAKASAQTCGSFALMG